MLGERSGEALTLTSLASKAQVSRRTLYTHWGTIERVISDAVSMQDEGEQQGPEGLTARQRLDYFFTSVRDRLHEPVTNVALASLVHQAAQDNRSTESIAELSGWPIERFTTFVAPVTPDQYSLLVGPIFLSEFVMRTPASDELLSSLVDYALDMLALSDVSEADLTEAH
jgi:AcrR family transcriptional regulator